MKKILLTVTIIITTITYSFAQNNDLSVAKKQFKVNLLLLPSLDYEKGITSKSTIGVNLGTELLKATNTVTDEFEIAGLFPLIKGYYRYYYNFERRASKNKNTTRNSGNYLSFSTTYIHPSPIIKGNAVINDKSIIMPAAIYGLQRTYNKSLNLGLEFGLGYSISNVNKTILPLINFNLGWVLDN